MLRRQAPQKVSATSRSFVAMAVCPASREDVNGKHRLAVHPSMGLSPQRQNGSGFGQNNGSIFFVT